MSETLGPATLQNSRSEMFLSEPQMSGDADYSERTAQAIDEEVRRLLTESQQRVHVTLSEKRFQLEALARALLQNETLDRGALLTLLATVPAQIREQVHAAAG